MTFARCSTCCKIPPRPPFSKGGTEIAPFIKGGRAQRGGIYGIACANLVWFDLDGALFRKRADFSIAEPCLREDGFGVFA
jgi:hypothetical protein